MREPHPTHARTTWRNQAARKPPPPRGCAWDAPPPKQNVHQEERHRASKQVPQRPRVNVLTDKQRPPDERDGRLREPCTVHGIAEHAHRQEHNRPCKVEPQEFSNRLTHTSTRCARAVREVGRAQPPEAQKGRGDKEERNGDTVHPLDKRRYAEGSGMNLHDQECHQELHGIQIGKRHSFLGLIHHGSRPFIHGGRHALKPCLGHSHERLETAGHQPGVSSP